MILSLTKDGRETGSKSINLLPLSHSHPFLKDKIYVTGRKAREKISSFSSLLEGYRKVYYPLSPPAVKPETKFFWRKKNRTQIGTAIRIAPAAKKAIF